MPVAVNGVGAAASGIGNVTVTYPTRSNNDILLMFMESASNEVVSTVTAGAGGGAWERICSLTTADSTGSIFWTRWTTGQASQATITDPGDHVIGAIISFSGCITTGRPIDGFGSISLGTSSTTQTLPNITTDYYNTLVVNMVTSGRDFNFSTEFSGWTNSSLVNSFGSSTVGPIERLDAGTNSGNGGGFGVATGFFTGVGSTDFTTVTLANAAISMCISLNLVGEDSSLPHIGWGFPTGGPPYQITNINFPQ